MHAFTPSQISRVRDAVPIAAVVGQYVKLRPGGADTMTGICPFHSEKTGSLKLHPAAGYYHCFGCGAGGGAVDFLMRAESLPFPVALRRLATDYGVSLEDKPVSNAHYQMAVALAGEAQWWWTRVRRWLVAGQHEVVDCEKRAEAFLAARLEASDSPGIEYAWWWIANADRLYYWLAGMVDTIDSMAPIDKVQGYSVVRARMGPVFRREKLNWDVLRNRMEAEIRGQRTTAS